MESDKEAAIGPVAQSSFKPSFPNPAVWTDDLMRMRQMEYAAFLRTNEGIAETRSFETAYSEFETRRENGGATGGNQQLIGLNSQGPSMGGATRVDAMGDTQLTSPRPRDKGQRDPSAPANAPKGLANAIDPQVSAGHVDRRPVAGHPEWNTQGKGLTELTLVMNAFLGYCKVDSDGINVNETIVNKDWKSKYFDPFLHEMVAAGFTNDGGAGCGMYGVPHFHKGAVALIAKCYPPADAMGLNGLSKIMVGGLVAGGTKQASFYFDSAESFQKALHECTAQVVSRLGEARETIDHVHSMVKDGPGWHGQPPSVVCTVHEGIFSGAVVEVSDDGIVTQKVDRAGTTVSHDAAKLTAAVKVGDVIDVQYCAGRGIVSGVAKAPSMGR